MFSKLIGILQNILQHLLLALAFMSWAYFYPYINFLMAEKPSKLSLDYISTLVFSYAFIPISAFKNGGLNLGDPSFRISVFFWLGWFVIYYLWLWLTALGQNRKKINTNTDPNFLGSSDSDHSTI